METITQVLRINGTIVYFSYGLVFFTMGVVIALQPRRHSRLSIASHLNWLAAFGVIHGFNEWGHVFIPIQAAYLPIDAVRLLYALQTLTLALSFYLLLQFGTLVAFSQPGSWSWRYMFPIGLVFVWLVLWLTLTVGLGMPSSHNPLSELRLPETEAEELTRVMLGFTGAALASFGMLRQARSVAELGSRRMVSYFRWTAFCMGFYAAVAGLVTSPIELLATDRVAFLFGGDMATVYAPVLRSVAGLGIAIGVIRGLTIFEIETERFIQEAERSRLRAADRARLALDTIAATVGQPLPPSDLIDVALEKVLEIMGSPAGWAMLVRPEDGALEVRASRGLDGHIAAGMLCSVTQDCTCRRIVDGREDGSAHISNCVLCSEGFSSARFVSVPLRARERAVGILNLADRAYGAAEEMGLLASIGKQVGLAMDNARLREELQHKEEARAYLLGRVIVAQEDERKRVARELHDETGQGLSAVIMGLGAAAETLCHDAAEARQILDDTREIAVGTLDGIRKLILGLRPAILDDLGLVPALRRLADELSERSSTAVRISADGLSERLSSEVETVLFRILQEGMNNAARHARAHRIILRLWRDKMDVRATLEDDGIGFNPTKATVHFENGSGLGLLGMQERASILGGEVSINSSPGCGTTLSVRLPLVERE
ncbi:MAG: GAF domain-containing sensor histidine kinase [Candidatus Marsarchaeota archaeon]|nr:GAF domain-containing sensor histidine kinase [Candidatus Marsarchaeota archaeon]